MAKKTQPRGLQEARRGILQGDAIELLKHVPARGVDAVITDPPYSLQVHDNSFRSEKSDIGVKQGGKRKRDLGFHALDALFRDDLSREFARICRRWCLIFCDERAAHLWRISLENAGMQYIRTGWWVKLGATPQLTGDRPAVPGEYVVIAHGKRLPGEGNLQWNGGGRHAIWTHPKASGRERGGHTTAKPVGLLEQLVRDFTEPGELVLDPLAGSGTTGVACKRLGREFLGFELQEGYARTAARRIARTREQLDFTAAFSVRMKQEGLGI